ncbi:MAG: putative quinol monooxygenase [Gammaproteobacteria bacterium]
MSARVHVVTTFEVAEDAAATFVEAAERLLIAPVRREPGCERCELVREHALPSRYALIETWASVIHLETHFAQPTLHDALEALRPLVLASPQITRYVDATPA